MLVAILIICQLADLATFLVLSQVKGIGGEANPLMVYLFNQTGLIGPVTLKLAGIGLMVLVLRAFPESYWPWLVAVGAILGLIGAASNVIGLLS